MQPTFFCLSNFSCSATGRVSTKRNEAAKSDGRRSVSGVGWISTMSGTPSWKLLEIFGFKIKQIDMKLCFFFSNCTKHFSAEITFLKSPKIFKKNTYSWHTHRFIGEFRRGFRRLRWPLNLCGLWIGFLRKRGHQMRPFLVRVPVKVNLRGNAGPAAPCSDAWVWGNLKNKNVVNLW